MDSVPELPNEEASKPHQPSELVDVSVVMNLLFLAQIRKILID